MTRRAARTSLTTDAKGATKQFNTAKIKPIEWVVRAYFQIGEERAAKRKKEKAA